MTAGGRFLLAVLAVAATGCEALRVSEAKTRFIEDETRQHVYSQPISQVWTGVRQLLFERGFEARDSDVAGSFAVETAPMFSPDGKTKCDYLLLGTKITEASCKVEFTKRETGPTGTTSGRDLDLEWTLLQRIDPEEAARIMTGAREAGRQARDE
jgi:hypothetical protein